MFYIPVVVMVLSIVVESLRKDYLVPYPWKGRSKYDLHCDWDKNNPFHLILLDARKMWFNCSFIIIIMTNIKKPIILLKLVVREFLWGKYVHRTIIMSIVKCRFANVQTADK